MKRYAERMVAGDVLGLPCSKGMRPSVRLNTLGAGAAERSLPLGFCEGGAESRDRAPRSRELQGACSADHGSEV